MPPGVAVNDRMTPDRSSLMIRPAAVDVMNWVSIAIRTGRTKSSNVISIPTDRAPSIPRGS
jgi:hypothetical protein